MQLLPNSLEEAVNNALIGLDKKESDVTYLYLRGIIYDRCQLDSSGSAPMDQSNNINENSNKTRLQQQRRQVRGQRQPR